MIYTSRPSVSFHSLLNDYVYLYSCASSGKVCSVLLTVVALIHQFNVSESTTCLWLPSAINHCCVSYIWLISQRCFESIKQSKEMILLSCARELSFGRRWNALPIIRKVNLFSLVGGCPWLMTHFNHMLKDTFISPSNNSPLFNVWFQRDYQQFWPECWQSPWHQSIVLGNPFHGV